jgi:hypothetical protein
MRGEVADLRKRTSAIGQGAGPLVICIQNNPEAQRLGFLFSDRQALIGSDRHEALEGESIEAFHDRLKGIAKERGIGMIVLGHESNVEPAYAAGGERLN